MESPDAHRNLKDFEGLDMVEIQLQETIAAQLGSNERRSARSTKGKRPRDEAFVDPDHAVAEDEAKNR
jgi:hypothetical protein